MAVHGISLCQSLEFLIFVLVITSEGYEEILFCRRSRTNVERTISSNCIISASSIRSISIPHQREDAKQKIKQRGRQGQGMH